MNEKVAIAQQRQRTRTNFAGSNGDRPPPPRHLSAEARSWWSSVVAETQPQQARVLQMAGEALDRYLAAGAVLKAKGMAYADERGRQFSRPEIKIENDSRTAFLRCCRELGLFKPPMFDDADDSGSIGISWRQLQDR